MLRGRNVIFVCCLLLLLSGCESTSEQRVNVTIPQPHVEYAE